VVIDALQAYQMGEKADQTKKFEENLAKQKDFLHGKELPATGPADADVVIVEFLDYNCGYCKRAANEVRSILKDDTKIRVVFVDFPILSDSSVLAAQWSLAAHRQGKYFDYHMKLMDYTGEKNADLMEKFGKDLGLDVAKLRKDAESQETRALIEKNISVARELGLSGTPAFIFGDMLVPGYVDAANMKNIIAEQRKK
jgi:protein-disulfide isomerase